MLIQSWALFSGDLCSRLLAVSKLVAVLNESMSEQRVSCQEAFAELKEDVMSALRDLQGLAALMVSKNKVKASLRSKNRIKADFKCELFLQSLSGSQKETVISDFRHDVMERVGKTLNGSFGGPDREK